MSDIKSDSVLKVEIVVTRGDKRMVIAETVCFSIIDGKHMWQTTLDSGAAARQSLTVAEVRAASSLSLLAGAVLLPVDPNRADHIAAVAGYHSVMVGEVL